MGGEILHTEIPDKSGNLDPGDGAGENRDQSPLEGVVYWCDCHPREGLWPNIADGESRACQISVRGGVSAGRSIRQESHETQAGGSRNRAHQISLIIYFHRPTLKLVRVALRTSPHIPSQAPPELFRAISASPSESPPPRPARAGIGRFERHGVARNWYPDGDFRRQCEGLYQIAATGLRSVHCKKQLFHSPKICQIEKNGVPIVNGVSTERRMQISKFANSERGIPRELVRNRGLLRRTY